MPPAALVVGFSPLWDKRLVPTLHALRSRGRAVGCVVVDTDDLLAADEDEQAMLARRLWRAEIEQRRRELVAGGVPAVAWTQGASIASVVAAMARQRNSPTGGTR